MVSHWLEACWSAGLPGNHVMGFTRRPVGGAAGEHAALVPLDQRGPSTPRTVTGPRPETSVW